MTQDTKKNGNTAMDSHEEKTIALSRRYVLKAAFAGVMAGLAVPLLPRLSAFASEASGGKALIVYFSRTGNTREVAGQIRKRTGGDMLELKTAHSYPEAYRATTEQAKRE